MDGSQTPEQGTPEQGIRIKPRIRESELKLNYKVLSSSIPGVDDTAVPKNQVDRILDDINLNAAFLDREKTGEMVNVVGNHIKTLEAKSEHSDEDLSAIQAAGLLKDFLTYAKAGDQNTALLVLRRAASAPLQQSIIESRAGLENVFGKYSQKPLGSITASFFELSELMYRSDYQGKRYESAETQKELEEQREEMKELKVS